MRNTLLTQSDERISSILRSIDKIRACMSVIKKNIRQRSLNNETYLTDRELSAQLKVSRRTLQEWRTKKIIAYIHIGGKILYRQSDIQTMLKRYHRKADD